MRAAIVLALLLSTGGVQAAAVDDARTEAGALSERVRAVRPWTLAQLEGDPSRAAAVAARLGVIEEDQRRLTGRIEELEFGQQRLRERLDKLVGDIDARLTGLEGSAEPAPSASPSRAASGDDRPEIRPVPPGQQAALPGQGGLAPSEGVLGTVPRGAVDALPRPPPGEVDYDGALAMLRAGRLDEAETAFRAFLASNPDGPRAANAAYWLAEAQFVRRNYDEAAASFARNYRTYGAEGNRAPDNLLKLGMSLRALGDQERACQSFAELARRHPDAPTAIKQTLGRERAAAGCG